MGLFWPISSIKKLGILVVSFVASSIWHGGQRWVWGGGAQYPNYIGCPLQSGGVASGCG
jgi:hypothetical protein